MTSRLVSLMVLTLLGACAGRIPLPGHLAASGAPELLARMQAAASPAQSFSAEARLTYFGKEGRVRVSASLAAARPASLRYDVLGPHGGVISAFASNGAELWALDVGASQFVYGPATAQNLDELLPFAPLGFGPPAFVGLLFGEVPVPPEARLSYDDRAGVFVLAWESDGTTRRVQVDPATSRVKSATVTSGERTLSQVVIEARGEAGLPAALHIRAPDIDVEVKLRDLAIDPTLDASVFVLDPPTGILPRRL